MIGNIWSNQTLPDIKDALKIKTIPILESMTYSWTVKLPSVVGRVTTSPQFQCADKGFYIGVKKHIDGGHSVYLYPSAPRKHERLDVHFGVLFCNPIDRSKKTMIKELTYSFVPEATAGYGIPSYLPANSQHLLPASDNCIVSEESTTVVLYLRVLGTVQRGLVPSDILSTADKVLEFAALLDSEQVTIILGANQTVQLPTSTVESVGAYLRDALSAAASPPAKKTRSSSAAPKNDNVIDLHSLIGVSQIPGVKLILALAHLKKSELTKITRVYSDFATIALALFSIETLEVPVLLFKAQLTESMSSHSNIYDFLVEFARLLSDRQLSYETLISLATSGLNIKLKGEPLMVFPLSLRGYRCELCVDDRDERGFCMTCSNAVYCTKCFTSYQVSRLNANYRCPVCKCVQKHDLKSILKQQNLDWSVDVFNEFLPALYLRNAHERKEFVDIFKLKRDLRFTLTEVPAKIIGCKVEIVKSLLPYLKMLIAAA